MAIYAPVKVTYNHERRTSKLWFPDGFDCAGCDEYFPDEPPEVCPKCNGTSFKLSANTITGEYYLMGGVSWPFAVLKGIRHSLRGYAVLCGMQVRTGMVTVFENTEFRSISPVENAEGKRVDDGLARWLNRNWMMYQARRYWWYEQGTVNERYAIALKKNREVSPKPLLTRCQWYDDGTPEHILWLRQADNSLRMVEALSAAVKKGDDDPKQPCVESHALLCALVGLEQKPWKDPKRRREWE